MASKANAKRVASASQSASPVSAEEKIARILGMIVTKEIENRGDKATLLRSVGFDIAEVAAMLGMSENHVKVATHHGRKKLKKRSS